MDQPHDTPALPQPHTGKPPVRWRPDASSVMSMSLALPGLLGSLIVMSLVGSAIDPRLAWILPVAWILSAPLPFAAPIQPVLARLMFDARRPTADEAQRISAVWHSVCQVAGVDGSRYLLLVQDSNDLNAFAAGGRIVAVTRPALLLEPRRLEAVLAHELGHHLSAHAAVSMLAWWYALPARVATYVVGLVTRIVLFVGRIFAAFGSGLGALAALLLALVILATFAFYLSFWLILMPLIAPLLAWAGRRGELSADRTAAKLGYGPALIEVLYSWMAMDPHTRRRAGLKEKLLATHPPHGDRIRQLERFLGTGGANR